MDCTNIFIIEAKIQKQRVKDMKNAATKRKIKISEKYGNDVTHVVTEFKELDQVLKKLNLTSVHELRAKEVVTVDWFAACMRAGCVVDVQAEHRIRGTTTTETASPSPAAERNINQPFPEYACQRSTPLQHHNERFTAALEVLEKYAELRDSDQDYSRALAFRRASCVLKSLPGALTDIRQLNNVTHIGGHSRRIIQEILEDGESQEVADILADPWFHKMKLFTGVFGIGPSTAKKWIERGWQTIRDAQQGWETRDWRVRWGLAFHEDLCQPVTKQEAEHILGVVSQHLRSILPGAVMQLTGGFRRGKPGGHDVDILITHPQLGRELNCLTRLIHSLRSHDIILCGNHETSSYSDRVLTQDFKLSMRGQLDHFEKWLGMLKVPKSVQKNGPPTGANVETVCKRSECAKQDVGTSVSEPVPVNAVETNKSLTNSEKNLHENGTAENNSTSDIHTVCERQNSLEDLPDRQNESLEEYSSHQRHSTNADLTPEEVSGEARDWVARRVDIIISPYDQYFYALVGWTGNKQFNRDLRTYATREKGMKLTSHGLYDMTKGCKVAASSEEEVFSNLGLKYREPEERNC